MKFLDYKKISMPDKDVIKEMHHLYVELYKTSFSLNKKKNIMTSIVGREVWSWRVVGISKNSVRKIISHNYKSSVKRELQRDHYFQGRNETYNYIFENFLNIDDWWKEVWDKDRTIILTKEEHSSKKTSNHVFNYDEEVFELDWTLGLFQCAKQVGFDYVQGREGYFIKNNFEKLV